MTLDVINILEVEFDKGQKMSLGYSSFQDLSSSMHGSRTLEEVENSYIQRVCRPVKELPFDVTSAMGVDREEKNLFFKVVWQTERHCDKPKNWNEKFIFLTMDFFNQSGYNTYSKNKQWFGNKSYQDQCFLLNEKNIDIDYIEKISCRNNNPVLHFKNSSDTLELQRGVYLDWKELATKLYGEEIVNYNGTFDEKPTHFMATWIGDCPAKEEEPEFHDCYDDTHDIKK
jgi:hypothetical protein